MARVVLYPEVLEEIDTKPAMQDLADAIAEDARMLAPKGETLGLASGIEVSDVTRDHALITSHAENPRSSEGNREYPEWVEMGTHRSKARPYMRPAALKYRS